MNPIQKAYEFQDLTLIYLKRSQSLYHIKNMGNIIKRKSHFINHPKEFHHSHIKELSSIY